MKKAPRPTSQQEAIIICWLWITWFAQHLPQSEAQGTGIFHSLYPISNPKRFSYRLPESQNSRLPAC